MPGEIEKLVVLAMDGEYAGIAGAYSCHLIGEEKFSILQSTPRGCVVFYDPTALSIG